VILKYKNGYDTKRIGDVAQDNIIYGTEDYDEDVARITEAGDAYILFYHAYYQLSNDWTALYIAEELQKRGYIDQVMNVYHTPLYWFTDDIQKVRASATLEAADLQAENRRLSGVFRVKNTGSTILAPDHPFDYGRLYLVLRQSGAVQGHMDPIGGVILGEFVSPLNPGESAELNIARDGLEPGKYQIELVSHGEYSFSELGLAPIPVHIVDFNRPSNL
jgi:hypothetical protein